MPARPATIDDALLFPFEWQQSVRKHIRHCSQYDNIVVEIRISDTYHVTLHTYIKHSMLNIVVNDFPSLLSVDGYYVFETGTTRTRKGSLPIVFDRDVLGQWYRYNDQQIINSFPSKTYMIGPHLYWSFSSSRSSRKKYPDVVDSYRSRFRCLHPYTSCLTVL